MNDRVLKIRLYVEAPLTPGCEIAASREQTHYLLSVMRLKAGERITVFNGRDGEWRATLECDGRKSCRLCVDEQLRRQDAEPDLWLCFAPLKKTRTDFVIEKATELGVSRLLPVFTRQTDPGRVNRQRLARTAVEAAEQCGRLSIPEVDEARDLEALLAAWPEDRILLVADESGAGRPLPEVLSALPKRPGGHAILIGPEGGFASSELDAIAKLPFAIGVDLGPRILRAETAAIAALACFQALAGDWKT